MLKGITSAFKLRTEIGSGRVLLFSSKRDKGKEMDVAQGVYFLVLVGWLGSFCCCLVGFCCWVLVLGFFGFWFGFFVVVVFGFGLSFVFFFTFCFRIRL